MMKIVQKSGYDIINKYYSSSRSYSSSSSSIIVLLRRRVNNNTAIINRANSSRSSNSSMNNQHSYCRPYHSSYQTWSSHVMVPSLSVLSFSNIALDGMANGSKMAINQRRRPLMFDTPPSSMSLSYYFYSSSSKINQTDNKQQRSPYVVLGLNKTNATTTSTTTTTTTTNIDGIKEITKNEIQIAFRQKAKLYHPDLNPSQLPTAECEKLMTELVEAYQILMENDEDDFISKYQVGYSNKVAIACELYTIKELQMDRFHSIYPIRIDYECDEDVEHAEFDDDDDDDDDDEKLNNDPIDVMVSSTDSNILSTVTVTPIQTHPDDSVSDFKRQIESQYGIEWGLLSTSTTKDNDSNNRNTNNSSSDGRRKVDRDGITIGWEVIVIRQQNDNTSNNNNKENNKLLSNHFFLGDDYQIKQGEIVYAVIRK